MWNAVVVQRALGPFLFTGLLMTGLGASIPELRTPFASSLLAITPLLLLLRPIARDVRWNSRYRTRVLLIGNKPVAQKFLEEVEANPRRSYTIVGLVEETPSCQPQYCPYLVLGTIGELPTIVGAVRPDRIVLAVSDRRGRLPVHQLLEFQTRGIGIEDVADAYERLSGKLAIEALTPGQLISTHGLGNCRKLKALQHVLSFAAALIGLILFAPLLVIIALAVKLESGGAVLFRQTRLGKGGRPFQLIKFRTMRPVEQPTSEWAQDNLQRITNVGQWLRRFRLDELPQLVNILRGDMNLVGPRPHPVCNGPLFREAIPYYMLRGSVLPGITGWAQVRYRYANDLEQETEKMRYDLYYIKHMSLWLDLRILLDTCRILLSAFTSPEVEPRRHRQPLFRPEPARMPVEWHPERPIQPMLTRVQYSDDPARRSAGHAR